MTSINSSIPQTSTKNESEQALTALFGHPVSINTEAVMLDYLAHGFHPIPLVAGEKFPPRNFPYAEVKSGELPITPDLIHDWRERWPDATNIGILCGPVHGTLIIDTDADHATHYFSDDLPVTPTAQASRGQHFYFKCPEDIREPFQWCGENALLPNIDILADGLIVAPPSLHPSGITYAEITPFSTPLATLPDWVHKLIRMRLGGNATPAATTRERTPAAPAPAAPSDLAAAIEYRLGVRTFNGHGWSNSVPCPFHGDQHASATWSRANGGMLKCHAGCTPGPHHLSHGLRTFGAVDTARELGIPLNVPRHTHQDGHATPAVTASGEQPTPGPNEASTSYSHFCPPLLNLLTRGVKIAKNLKRGGRAAQTFALSDIARMVADGGPVTYRALTRQDIASAKQYRALAYAPPVAGSYKRSALARAVGVSVSTARRYDDIAGVVVAERIDHKPLADRDEQLFTHNRKDYAANVWIESTSGVKYAPTIDGFREAVADSVRYNGKASAVLCRQRMNHYTPPERDDAPEGLPVEWRQALIREGLTTLARVVDALLLAKVRPGALYTAKRLIALCAPYGLSEATVRRALASVTASAPVPAEQPAPDAAAPQPRGPMVQQPLTPGHHHAPDGEWVCDNCGAPGAEHYLTGVFCEACWQLELEAIHRARAPIADGVARVAGGAARVRYNKRWSTCTHPSMRR